MIKDLKTNTMQTLTIFAEIFQKIGFNVLNTYVTSREYPIDLTIIIFEAVLKN